MQQLLIERPWIIFLIVLWIAPWKGVALWKAAKNNHKGWFIALLVVNTLAILEILYIFYFSKKECCAIKEKEDLEDKKDN